MMPAPDPAPRLADLYTPLAPALHAWACVRLGADRARIAPEDLTQEVWLRAVEVFERFDGTRMPFRAWLFAVAKHVLLEVRRRLERFQAEQGAHGSTTRLLALDQVPLEVSTISRRLARDETVQQFVARVETLDQVERMTVVHCGLEGMPLAEAAARLGENATATAKRWQRLRERMANWAAPLGMVDGE